MICARCTNQAEVLVEAKINESDLKQNLWVCRECVREDEKVHEEKRWD